jgi:RNA polymerase-binding transcription factor DksA
MSQEDRAQEVEARDWEINNRPRQPAAEFAPGDPQYGPPECEDCDMEMPDLRRARGKRLCTACQELLERRARQWRG